jgi:hypothetical protein
MTIWPRKRDLAIYSSWECLVSSLKEGRVSDVTHQTKVYPGNCGSPCVSRLWSRKTQEKKKKGKMLVRNPRCQHEAFQITFPRVS